MYQQELVTILLVFCDRFLLSLMNEQLCRIGMALAQLHKKRGGASKGSGNCQHLNISGPFSQSSMMEPE
jgi:hypothetical protein